jgi:hypothetical protein
MKSSEFLKCPFCHSPSIKKKVGQTTCAQCGAEFELDDREECVFVDPGKLRLPIEGTVCSQCGLVQGDQFENCLCCGAKLPCGLQ